ncbi:MAG: hypothetical protein KF764_11375 [Labilithrix sp.]|nr:hypothetical protein [Labilithrix sp.]MBX3220971.1 hypothetical protein [Labilithrix sp.]
MMKKAFALASVTALTGLVVAVAPAGCTPDEAAPTDDGGGVADVKRPPPSQIGDDEDDPGGEKCYAEKALDVSGVKYQAPRIRPGACTEGVLKVIDDLVAGNKNATFQDLKAAIVAEESTSCAECVFGEDGDTWAPVVESAGKIVAVNGGGCVAIVSAKDDCGKAYYQWDECLGTACKDCSGSDRSVCLEAVQSTACKGASDALLGACGKDVNAYINACFKPGEIAVKGPIREQCVKGSEKDASTD